MWGWSVAAVAVVRVDGCAALPAGEKTEKAFDGRLSRTAVATGRLSLEREGKRTERRFGSGKKNGTFRKEGSVGKRAAGMSAEPQERIAEAFAGRFLELLAHRGVGDSDECLGSLSQVAALEIRYAVFGHDVLDHVARGDDPRAR